MKVVDFVTIHVMIYKFLPFRMTDYFVEKW
jgi:hypothetical protein